MNSLTQVPGRTTLTLKCPRSVVHGRAAPTLEVGRDDADNASVAGEEDPGAALEFTRVDSGNPRHKGVRPTPCDR
jgi:hypothetical protein